MTRVAENILLCTDLDRTILPNGRHDESPGARALLRSIANRPEVTLAYVSGRSEKLIHDAIREFGVPEPSYAIGDVGTTIYEVGDKDWHFWEAWSAEIAPDWNGLTGEQLAALLRDNAQLRPQEAEQQNRFKVSYYTTENVDRERLLGSVQERLRRENVKTSLIWSVDEAKHVGLLDVLPESATKLHAVQFLMRRKGFDEAHTVFAGDSGNDLPVLTSGLQAVLVGNASEEVRGEAVRDIEAKGLRDRLYLARGGFLGMNGNYAAGVLEGLAHFLPVTRRWLEAERR